MALESEKGNLQATVVWDVNEYEVPPHANQVLLHSGINGPDGSLDGVYLHLGHVMPPNSAVKAVDGEIQEVPAVTLGSYFLTVQALELLAGATSDALKQIKTDRERGQK